MHYNFAAKSLHTKKFWKVLGRLPVRHNWTFVAISYGWHVISGNLSKSAFFQGGGSFWARRPPTTAC